MNENRITLNYLKKQRNISGNLLFDDVVQAGLKQIVQFESRKKIEEKIEAFHTIHIETDLPSGQIEFSVLSEIMSGIQEMVSGAFDFAYNKDEKSNIASLALVAVEPGSFIIKFTSKENAVGLYDNQEKLELGEIDEVDNMVGKLMNGVNELRSVDDGKEFASEFGGTATKKTVRLLNKLHSYGTEFEYFKNPSNPIQFKLERMQEVTEILKKIIPDKQVQAIPIKGFLVGINNKSNKIWVELPNKTTIVVNVKDKRLSEKSFTTNRSYELQATRIIEDGNDKKISYFVESVDDIAEMY